ncbi:transmembrane protein 150A [Rhinichthys klamathensis goyatoka]|uniref:transmembrane protein 150A n=1 Tax=Rhinichthys klamathensis goyatoka TaxID=3034132 RepID=UPI0024B49498|nr:transmembrane protein 150A [Rhinichthys klamathensis goyatoka]
MAVWVILPIVLCAVSFIGCWTVYGLALHFNHVCSLTNWEYRNSCQTNETGNCCTLENVPTISTSGANFPENSLFTATINAGSFLFLIFCIFHHAHILDRNHAHSLLSKIAMILGCVVSMGAFMAGNCNPTELMLLHYLGAALSFLCVCLYMTILTSLTSKCVMTGCERVLYPLRSISTIIQVSATILYGIFFIHEDYYYKHISAVFEWLLSVNLQLYELSYSAEFYFFSSSMLSVLLAKKEEEKCLILS